MEPQGVFLVAVAGSLSAECVNILNHYRAQRAAPPWVRMPVFWVCRLFVAAMGGVLSLAHGVDSALLAIHIGAATPLIIQSFASAAPTPAAPTS